MDAVTLKTELEPLQDVWKKDKKLLKGGNLDLDINWKGVLPDSESAGKILMRRQEKWLNPIEPFELNRNCLDEILNQLTLEVESVWGTKLLEKLDIEVLSSDNFLPRIQQLDEETNKKFGYGEVFKSPPTMYIAPDHGKLLIPQKYLIRTPKSILTGFVNSPNFSLTSLSSSDFDVKGLGWDKPFFEQVLTEEISHILFRQLRGEWKEDFVKVMKKLGPDRERKIFDLNEAVAQYVKERIARNKNQNWRLYVIADKIGTVWQSYEGMRNYISICTLSQSKSLTQIAMVDSYSLIETKDGLIAEFYTTHPNYKSKKQKFEN